jgi:hypothetical protein
MHSKRGLERLVVLSIYLSLLAKLRHNPPIRVTIHLGELEAIYLLFLELSIGFPS